MVEIGCVIEAVVVRIESYAVFLHGDGEEVVVLVPELSWRPVRHPREAVRVGDRLKVLVLRYNYEKRQIVASLRRLHQEDNPYRELSRLPPGDVLQGTVTFAAGDDLTVRLPNGAWGLLPKRDLPKAIRVGEKVCRDRSDGGG